MLEHTAKVATMNKDGGTSNVANQIAVQFGVTTEFLAEFAEFMAVNFRKEPFLLPIVAEAMTAPLPNFWVECHDANTDQYYYANTKTRQSTWEHPLDHYFKELLIAKRSRHGSEDVRALLEHKAKVDAVNKDGETALMRAASEGHTACAALLLRHGADVARRAVSGDYIGKSALEIAEIGKAEIAKMLRDPELLADAKAVHDKSAAEIAAMEAALAAGMADQALAPGMRLRLDDHGEGTYERFEKKTSDANVHFVRIEGKLQPIRLKGLESAQWSVLPHADPRRLCRTRQLLMFVRGAVQPAGTSHCGDMVYDLLTTLGELVTGAVIPTHALAERDAAERDAAGL